MNEEQIAEVWTLFKEYLDKKQVEIAAERYIDMLADGMGIVIGSYFVKGYFVTGDFTVFCPYKDKKTTIKYPSRFLEKQGTGKEEEKYQQ